MSEKYTARHLSSVSRDSSFTSETGSKEPDWFQSFVSNLEKESVKSRCEDYSLFDQINQAVSGKSKYSSVEEAVQDMQERTGLKTLLQAKAQQQMPQTPQQDPAKQQLQVNQPQLFEKVPALKNFIDNYVEARPGTSVDSVIHDLLKIQQFKANMPEADDVPTDIKEYINKKIGDRVNEIPTNISDDNELGKVDLTLDQNALRDDPLGMCMPNREGR